MGNVMEVNIRSQIKSKNTHFPETTHYDVFTFMQKHSYLFDYKIRETFQICNCANFFHAIILHT